MFYKDCLFTFPSFWLGFVNNFSGQTPYEPWIYQGFNILFTCVPIMWWCTLDLEFTKKFLVSTPQAYYIGPTNDCFGTKKFLAMIAETLFNGFVIVALVYYGFNDASSVSQKSKAGEFWVDGNLMYMAVVIITNMKIAFKTHNHTWTGTWILVGSVLSYFLWYEIENAAKGYWPLYHTFD